MRGRAAQAALMAARGWSPAAQPAVRCTVLPAGSAQVASRPARPVSGSYSNVASGSTTSSRRRRKVTLHKLAQLHNRGEPIVMITAYDVFAGRVAEVGLACLASSFFDCRRLSSTKERRQNTPVSRSHAAPHHSGQQHPALRRRAERP